jgi:hypothetical protein
MGILDDLEAKLEWRLEGKESRKGVRIFWRTVCTCALRNFLGRDQNVLLFLIHG